jgi:hypothetical protein
MSRVRIDHHGIIASRWYFDRDQELKREGSSFWYESLASGDAGKITSTLHPLLILSGP